MKATIVPADHWDIGESSRPRLPWTQENAGANPAIPTIFGVASTVMHRISGRYGPMNSDHFFPFVHFNLGRSGAGSRPKVIYSQLSERRKVM